VRLVLCVQAKEKEGNGIAVIGFRRLNGILRKQRKELVHSTGNPCGSRLVVAMCWGGELLSQRLISSRGG
jgi:hypothetical protein